MAMRAARSRLEMCMMKNKASWVALIVLAIASLLMVFFVLPNIDGSENTVTAEKPAQEETKPADAVADAKGARPMADAAGQTETPAAPAPTGEAGSGPADGQQASSPEGTDPTLGWTVPGFDVLRVEPDGSTVIAGRAQPNTKLEIVDGDTVVATADVGATGDFAAIFDKPLPAGDYQLSLRSVGENGATKSSQEVATVSIPKDGGGELLAMVSKPGEASRIITTPTENSGAAAQKPTADAKPTDATEQSTPAAGNAEGASPETAAVDPAGQANTQAPADMSAAAPATDAGSAAPAAGDNPAVAVSAVEIEGQKIFVAGKAKAGSLVRIYADDILVGEMKADEAGRFVVDGTIDLSVGSHTIRADVVDANGKVELRAAVPFDRPVGDQVAAVAEENVQGAVVPFEGGSFDGLRMEATKALGLLKGLFENGKVPTAEELAAARSATEIALKSLADYKVAANLDANVKEMAAKTAKGATDALALLKSLPQDAASVSASLGNIEAAVDLALMPRTDGNGMLAAAPAQDTAPAQDAAATQTDAAQGDVEKPAPATQSAATEPAQPETTAEQNAAATADSKPAPAPAVDTAAAEPVTVQQAPLRESKSSVIIRRGDTLWQISRRVYGAGVRYTTIYLANEGQITNPDRILPGQVFGVPDEAMSEAEAQELHRKRMNKQP